MLLRSGKQREGSTRPRLGTIRLLGAAKMKRLPGWLTFSGPKRRSKFGTWNNEVNAFGLGSKCAHKKMLNWSDKF